MDIVTIDFETYWDTKYSLSKMTMEAYIRDDRFEVQCVSVKVNGNPTDVYSGTNVGGFLNSIDYTDKAILCHNTYFDGAVLAWVYGIKPRLWLDTQGMSKPEYQMSVGTSLDALTKHYNLGKKGGVLADTKGIRLADMTPEQLQSLCDYCVQDSDITYELFNVIKKTFPAHELMIIDQALRMYTEPTVILDIDMLEKHLGEVRQDKSDLIATLNLTGFTEAQVKKALMSNAMFAKLLEGRGVEVPVKTSPTTGKVAFAFAKTDLKFMALADHPNPEVSNLVKARLGVKSTIEETRTARLVEVSKRGYLPIMIKYYGAHTGRFSGGDKLNLQNFPRNGTMRESLTVPLGYKMIACDSSQIEARMTAYVSNQTDLLDAFKQGRDVYSEFATDVYGYTVNKTDKLKRFVGKTCILGLGYGMGADKFIDTLAQGQGGLSVDIDKFEGQRIVNLYRQKNHRIVGFWRRCGTVLTAMLQGGSGQINDILSYDHNGILMPNGLRIHYPELRASTGGFGYLSDPRAVSKHRAGEALAHSSWIKIYGGKVVENIVQALARTVVAEQSVRIGQRYHVSFQVHDEIIIIVKEEEADDAMAFMIEEMSKPPTWAPDLPVACEAGMGNNYGEAK